MFTNTTATGAEQQPREPTGPGSTTASDTTPGPADRAEDPGGATPKTTRLLGRLTAAAVAAVPGGENASITLYTNGHFVMQAASGPHIDAVEQQQVRCGAGPCLDALRPPGVVVVCDLHTDARWPHMATVALTSGIRSVLAVALGPVAAPSGVLAVYSARPDAFTEHGRAAGAAFAMHAAIAAESATHLAGQERAVQTRDVIGQAKGILIERYGLTPEQAFKRLVQASQHSNIKLSEVARWLVTQTSGHDPSPTLPPLRPSGP